MQRVLIKASKNSHIANLNAHELSTSWLPNFIFYHSTGERGSNTGCGSGQNSINNLSHTRSGTPFQNNAHFH